MTTTHPRRARALVNGDANTSMDRLALGKSFDTGRCSDSQTPPSCARSWFEWSFHLRDAGPRSACCTMSTTKARSLFSKHFLKQAFWPFFPPKICFQLVLQKNGACPSSFLASRHFIIISFHCYLLTYLVLV